MKKITLLDLYTETCGPCKVLSPIIDSLKSEYVDYDNIDIRKINVRNEPEVTASYGVRNVPTLIYLEDDVEVHRSVGLVSKETIKEKINSLLD